MLQSQSGSIATENGVATIKIPPAPPTRPLQLRRALRALRELLNHPDRTEKAFEIFAAIDGNREEYNFQRFAAHPVGRRLLARRPSLVQALCDRDALSRLPAESFGRAYLDYLERTGFQPTGLIDLKNALQEQFRANGEQVIEVDSMRAWFRDRTLLMHDLWHVLSGYGTDELGEAALLPFSCAQGGGRANALLVLGVAVRGMRQAGPGFLRYLFQAYRRGRKAVWLTALPYEDLLPQPLETVRRIAAIPPPEDAHPRGILRGSWSVAPAT